MRFPAGIAGLRVMLLARRFAPAPSRRMHVPHVVVPPENRFRLYLFEVPHSRRLGRVLRKLPFRVLDNFRFLTFRAI